MAHLNIFTVDDAPQKFHGKITKIEVKQNKMILSVGPVFTRQTNKKKTSYTTTPAHTQTTIFI